MTPEETIRAYYDALRNGESLASFFVESPTVVKYGIGERLVGYVDIANGLEAQTARTRDWVVESDNLHVVTRETHAAFSDEVRLEWYDTDDYEEHSYDTRWSGTLTRTKQGTERSTDEGSGTDSDPGDATDTDTATATEDEWKFLGLHVSVPGPTAEE